MVFAILFSVLSIFINAFSIRCYLIFIYGLFSQHAILSFKCYAEGSTISAMFRNSRPEVFCKKCVLRNFAKFTGILLSQSVFFNKVADFNLQYYAVIVYQTKIKGSMLKQCEELRVKGTLMQI